MKTVNIHHAKTHLSRLVEAAVAGEEVIIAKAGKPLVRLVPLDMPDAPRRPGALKGRVWIGDEFDAPLPREIAEALGGGS